jgi:hypothetical protein
VSATMRMLGPYVGPIALMQPVEPDCYIGPMLKMLASTPV